MSAVTAPASRASSVPTAPGAPVHPWPPAPVAPSADPAVPQLHLPGQAAAPEGPLDMTMMYLMHHAFRRDLRTFAEAVPLTPLSDEAAWQAMTRRWALFSTCLHLHHHEEDTWLWPDLMRRVEPEERATLEAMEAEHAEIDPALEVCRDGLAWMSRRPDREVRAALTVRLAAAREGLARHLAHEESDTIAMMQRVMTSTEWTALEENFGEGVTPGLLLKIVPWVLHEVPAEVREQLFTRPRGRAHRAVWLLTRGRFDRTHRAAFRHLEG